MAIVRKRIKPPAEAERLAAELAKNRDVDAVYLFGSFARGEQKTTSDIDICVIARENASRRELEGLADASDNLDVSVFQLLPPQVRYRVLKEGKPLFVRDESRIRSLEVFTVLDYLDFKHIIDRRFSRIVGG